MYSAVSVRACACVSVCGGMAFVVKSAGRGRVGSHVPAWLVPGEAAERRAALRSRSWRAETEEAGRGLREWRTGPVVEPGGMVVKPARLDTP